MIGSGIFTLTGTAAAGKPIPIKSMLEATVIDLLLNGSHATSQLGRPGAGPAITLSFVLVAIACLFAGLCYAELASMIPVAGSVYTYSYAIMGEIVAWIIGWDLILEYAVSNMSVAVGFSAYLQDLFDNMFGFHLPPSLAFPPFPAPGGPAGVFNIPALLITLLVTWVLVRGVRESAGANTTMVLIKIAAIVIFCVGAAGAINPGNWHPFAPHGFSGHSDRRFHRLLHLHRIRFDLDRGRRVPQAAARSALRHHRDTDRLHHALLQRFAGADRHCEL